MPPSATPSPKKRSASSGGADKSTGVMDYLRRSVPRATLLELFVEPDRGRFVCRAIMQQLSGVAQQVVVRLSCTGGRFPVQGVQIWTNLRPNAFGAMLKELNQWSIVTPESAGAAKGATEVIMTPEFCQGLQASLAHLDASPWQALQPTEIDAMWKAAAAEQQGNVRPREPVTTETLERYTQSQWDSVLHFLVGTVGYKEPPAAVVHFLMQTGMMAPDPEDTRSREEAALVITDKGYEFMLMDHNLQIWNFVVCYLKSLETHEKGEELRREALLLLICLSFARFGEAYLATSLKKNSRVMVKDLALFGLLYTTKIRKSTIFYPTRVAMQLVGSDNNGGAGGSASASSGAASTLWALSSKALDASLAHPRPHDSSHLAIIVQTNFQLCAYTTSELHVSMLGLFCDVQTIRRLPNVVFMFITRSSVQSAFSYGIKAGQILRFLEKHAHPKLRTATNLNIGTANNSPVPANVVDQIWLWDRERNRVNLTEVYQHQCLMDGEFQAVVKYTKNLSAHAWSSEARRTVLVDYAHVERVQKFVRQWRAKAAARNQE